MTVTVRTRKSYLRTRLILGAVTVALWMNGAATPAAAQNSSTPAPAPPPASAAGNTSPGIVTPSRKVQPTYRIAREDSLSILVIDRPDVSMNVTVLPDGTINYPYLNEIKVVGMSVSELQKLITKGLDKYYVNPRVVVTVRERQIQSVSVLGTAVRTTGKQTLRDGWRLLDVIAAAGGLGSDRFEFYQGQLVRPSEGTVTSLDLARVYANDPAANVELQPDDIVIINTLDENKTQVQVSGAVLRPGAYVAPRDGSIATVLNQAGGPMPNALVSEATIEREGQTIKVDLREMIKTGVAPEGARLQPGDRLVLRENKEYFHVVGAVARQGNQPYPDDRKLSVSTVLMESGISIQAAEHKHTLLIRPQTDGTTKSYEINVEKMLKDGDMSQDMLVQPGDVVYVPYKANKRRWDAFSVLNILNFLPGLGYLADRF